MAVVSSLCDGGNVDVFSDELNHASIVDGARLAMRLGGGTNRLHVYRHNDMAHLEELLRGALGAESAARSAGGGGTAEASSQAECTPSSSGRGGCGGISYGMGGGRAAPSRRRLVVTDSLFSMDGDFADLKVRLLSWWEGKMPI